MPINIPEYYKSFFLPKGTLLDAQNKMPKKLSVKDAINIQDIPQDKAMDKSNNTKINTNSIDLSKYDFKLPIASSNPESSSKPEIMVIDNELNPIDYYNFQDCVNSMKELSDDQITTLRNAIITSTESIKCSGVHSDTYGMRISQTNFELKYISKNLVPEKYQEQFNALVDNYTKGLSTKSKASLENTANQLIHTTSPSLINSGWRERGQEMLNSIKNGSDIFSTTEKIYSKLYNNLDYSGDQNVKLKIQAIFNNFIEKGQSYTKDSATNEALVNEVKYLSEKWNTVMDEMKNDNNLKLKTSINCLG